MDFPPYQFRFYEKSLLGEGGNDWTQISPEPLNPKNNPSQTIFIKRFRPVVKNDYIDVEFQEVFDQKTPSSNLPKGQTGLPRNAISFYYKAAQGNRPDPHTIDLYV